MPLSVWDGTAWRPVAALWAWDGTAWKAVHELHVWNGNEWIPLLSPVEVDPQITFIIASADFFGARVTFTVNNNTRSVLVECEFFGPGGNSYGRQEVELINTSPGGSYVSNDVTPPPDAVSVTFYCTPFSGENATGVQGPTASASATIGASPSGGEESISPAASEGTDDDSGADEPEDTSDS